MSITDAINVFLYTSLNRGGLPFDLHPPVPNAETLVAIVEVQEDETQSACKQKF